MSFLVEKVTVVVACDCGYKNDFDFSRNDLYSSITQQCEECDERIDVDVIVSVRKGVEL